MDPNSVSEEDFIVSETSMSYSGEDADNDDIDVSFETPVFSTFTITWRSSSGDNSTTTNLRFRYDYSTMASITVHYIDENGNAISRPNEIGNNVDQNIGWKEYTDVNIQDRLAKTIRGYTYKGAYRDSAKTKLISSIREFLTSDGRYYYRYIYFLNGTETVETNESYLENAGDIYLVYESNGPTSVPHATIHYVDENNNELTVSKGSISSATLLNNYAYLIYDIEGGEYEYKEAYIRRNSTDTAIKAYLRWNGSNWRYTTDGSNWSNVNENDDIYVVYKKKATPTEGGTPTLVKLDENDKPERPTVTKGSKVNGDRTNTISLSVTSHTKPREVLKLADVIVIFDRSGSMGYSIEKDAAPGKNEKDRMTLLKDAVGDLADALIGDNSEYIYTDKDGVEHKQIEMSLISFSNNATDATAFTDDAATFKEYVEALSAEGGTNWEQALQKANEASVDSGRATFVIFVTDGEPTFRMTRMTDTDSSLNDDMYSNGPDYYNSNNVYGTGSSDKLKDDTDYGRNYRAALAQARAIVGKNKKLYMIGVGPKVDNLEQFNTDAGADGYYPATSSEALTSAFEDIKKRIAAMAGYSDFQITDGITDLTQTVQKSTLVNFPDDDFTYYKGHAATAEDVKNSLATTVGEMVWETWNPTSEACAEAEYKNGAVVWNMGSSFMPQEGYTYQVRFKVWPSQEAYDLLANLNNAPNPAAAYAALDESVRKQISEPTTSGGMYTLKTNSVTSYNYKDATIVDGTVTPNGDDLLKPAGEFGDVDPLELTTRPLKIKKQWHNNYAANREPVSSITMQLYGVDSDGTTSHDFKTITLNDPEWYEVNNYISYGLVTYDTATNAGAKIYETGHDFTLREIDDEAHYFELTAGIFRPMFINGTPTILEKVDAAPAEMGDSVFHYIDGSNHYYRLDGKIYRNTESDILLLATNSRRSYMDLNKVVVDNSGMAAVDDTEFEYIITFTVPAGIANYEDVEKYIWFNVYDNVAGRTLEPSEYTHSGVITPADENPEEFSGPEYANYLVAKSGQQMTLKIKQGWNVRFLNLPIGTTYSFEETSIPEGYNFVKAEVSGTRWIADMVDGTDEGSAVDMMDLPATSGDNNSTAISGTIDFANARYKTTYTNKAPVQHVKIKKATQNGTTPLSGAVFSLYTESGYIADPKQAAKTGLTSDNYGMIDLGSLVVGNYYLVETKAPDGYNMLTGPVKIFVTGTGVSSQQSDYQGNKPVDAKAVTVSNPNDRTTDTYYTVIVNNNPGVELPQTGGEGTLHLRYLGMIVMLGAALLLMARQRQKKES